MTTYYVKNGGDNGRTGLSDDQAWATLVYAESQLSSGDVVRVSGGIYGEYFTINVPDVTFQNYPGETPIIDGGHVSPSIGNWPTIVLIEANGVTVDGITVRNSARYGVYINGVNDVTLKNCEIYENYGHCLSINNGADDALIEDCDIHHGAKVVYEFCDGSGGKCRDLGWGDPPTVMVKYSDRPIFRRTKIHDSYNEGINIDVGTNNALVEYCEIYGNLKVQLYVCSCTNNTVRHNLVYGDAAQNGPGIYFNHESQWVPTMGNPLISNSKVYGNLIANTSTNLSIAGDTDRQVANVQVYNNTFIEATEYGFLMQTGTGGGHSFKNNIIWQTDGQISNIPGGKVECDYNLWSRTPDIDSRGTNDPPYAPPQLSKTSGWNNLTGGELNGSEFVLQSGSPAIDAGTNLGVEYDDALNPASTWPDGVTTLDQDDYGSGWEIGAFVYTDGTTYYVKNGGYNSRTGLSDDQAWETITYVNSVNFANDDVVCFKRGSTFTDATLTLDSTSVGRSGITVQDYGTGSKPWINGNSVPPVSINHALVDLTIKNIDISGSDTSGTRFLINNVNGIIIDSIDYDGHIGSSSYVRSTAMAVSYVDGDIEIKNCTLQNAMKDTFANTSLAWGSNDANGLTMYYAGDDNVKSSGIVTIHDNIIHDVYSDCMQIAGMNTTVNIYDNELYNFGENAIDMKHSKYIDFYRNTISHNDYGVKAGYGGPTAIGSGLSEYWDTFKASDNIVRENYIHTSKYTAIHPPGDDAIIKNNYIKNCGLGVRVGYTRAKIYNNVFEMNTGTPTLEPYASQWIGTMLSGIRFDYNGRSDVLIANNIFYISSPDHLYGIAIQADADVTGTIIKNNIIHMTRDSASVFPLYVQDYDNAGNLPTVQNNLLYGAHSNRVSIEETSGNWVTYDSTEQADWRAAGHTGALFADPLLVNPGSGDLTLQSSSPAIDAGANLGVDYDDALNPTSTWPNNVQTLDQDDYGNGWEIGAYVYTGAGAGVPYTRYRGISRRKPSFNTCGGRFV